jgi:hypothetical protein
LAKRLAENVEIVKPSTFLESLEKAGNALKTFGRRVLRQTGPIGKLADTIFLNGVGESPVVRKMSIENEREIGKKLFDRYIQSKDLSAALNQAQKNLQFSGTQQGLDTPYSNKINIFQ